VSAGASPGPVCYHLGGVDPTLTDALLALGYLNETQLGGGAITLAPAASRDALSRVVATPLGRSVEEASFGILQLAVATMTRAVKAVTTYRGRDPRDFTLCAFGGNGPLTGVEIARALQICRVLVPPAPGVFSALGLLFSDTEHEAVRTLMLRGPEVSAAALEGAFAALAEEATANVVASDAAAVRVTRFADVRYAGQAYELPVLVPPGEVDVARLVADFVSEHVKTYGHGAADDPIDVVSVRAIARVERTTSRKYDPLAAIRALPALEGTRTAYFGPSVGRVETPVCNRAGLLAGERRGPLLIDEVDSTCVVPPGCAARLDTYGNIEGEHERELVVNAPTVVRLAASNDLVRWGESVDLTATVEAIGIAPGPIDLAGVRIEGRTLPWGTWNTLKMITTDGSGVATCTVTPASRA